MDLFFKVTALVVFLCFTEVVGKNSEQDLEALIIKSLLKDYDPSIRPSGGKNGTGPIEVEVNTYVRHIDSFDDAKNVFNVQLTQRQSWKDARLMFDSKNLSYITLQREKSIWVPDLFISNEDSGHFHDIVKSNFLLRVFPDGQVLYSTRISLRLFCSMDLHNYPRDNQVCSIILASYGFTSKHLVFFWKKENAIQLTNHLTSRKFKLNAVSKGDCTSKTITGEYSCLKIEFHLSRYFQTYLKDTYIPTLSMVILTWIVFWINPKNAIIRFGIWICNLLNLYILVISINFKTPETPYTKALDVWTGTCLTFVFFVGIELCLVKNALENVEALFENQNMLTNEDSAEEQIDSMKIEDTKYLKPLRKYCSMPRKWFNNYCSHAQKIDYVFRIIYPVAFLVFVFFYWIVYFENEASCEGEDCIIVNT